MAVLLFVVDVGAVLLGGERVRAADPWVAIPPGVLAAEKSVALVLFLMGLGCSLDALWRERARRPPRASVLAYARSFILADLGILAATALNAVVGDGALTGVQVVLWAVPMALALGSLALGVFASGLLDFPEETRHRLRSAVMSALLVGTVALLFVILRTLPQQGWLALLLSLLFFLLSWWSGSVNRRVRGALDRLLPPVRPPSPEPAPAAAEATAPPAREAPPPSEGLRAWSYR